MLNAIGMVKQLRPGDDVDTRCGKCKDIRSHVIIAVGTKGQVERVRCLTCKGEHNFRAPAKEPRKASSSASGRTSSSRAEVVPTGPIKGYSPQESFRAGDQVSHPTFGIGMVTDVREKKIDVKFGRELKILIHAGYRSS